MGLDILLQPQKFIDFTAADGSKSVTQSSFTTNIGLSSSEAIASGKNLFVFDSINFPTNPLRQVISDGGNYKIGTADSTLIIGTNDNRHLRIRAGGTSNSEIRMTVLSSGEVGIKTTLAQTRAQQLASISNNNFSNTSGMVFNGTDWYGGTIPSWTKTPEGTYDVYFTGVTYAVNLGANTGPGSNSCYQSLGSLPQLANVSCSFSNVFRGGAANATLSAAIFTDTFFALASGSYDTLGSYTLTAPNVPAGTNIIVGFWGQSGLTNVTVTTSNDTILTTLGSISANSVITSSKLQVSDGVVILRNLPTSSTGLPSGAVWNNGGVLNIV